MTHPLSTREDALRHILETMADHGLTLEDLKAARPSRGRKPEPEKTVSASKSETIMRLSTYIGASFIFAGIGIYIHTIWGDIGSAPRVIITLGTGFVAFVLGLLFARDQRLEKAAAPMHIIAFVMQPSGLFVLLREYFGGGSPALGAAFVFGLLAVQQVFTFITLKRASTLLYTLLYTLGFIGAAVSWLDLHPAFSALVTGLGFFLLTVDLQKRTTYKSLTPFLYIISIPILLSGLYFYSHTPVYDPLNLAVLLGFLAIAVLQNSKTLYVLSIACIVGYMAGGPGGGWHPWSGYAKWANMTAGTSIALTGLWLRRAEFTAATPLWFFGGAGFALGGAYSILYNTPYEPAYIGITALGVYAALLLKSRAALAASILSLVGFISYYTHKHFAGTTGWPLLLILLGFMLLAAGSIFMKLSRKIASPARL